MASNLGRWGVGGLQFWFTTCAKRCVSLSLWFHSLGSSLPEACHAINFQARNIGRAPSLISPPHDVWDKIWITHVVDPTQDYYMRDIWVIISCGGEVKGGLKTGIFTRISLSIFLSLQIFDKVGLNIITWPSANHNTGLLLNSTTLHFIKWQEEKSIKIALFNPPLSSRLLLQWENFVYQMMDPNDFKKMWWSELSLQVLKRSNRPGRFEFLVGAGWGNLLFMFRGMTLIVVTI